MISLNPTSVIGIIVLINTKNWIKISSDISNFIFYQLEFSAVLRENFPSLDDKIVSFHIWTNYRIQDREPIRLLEIQYPVLSIFKYQ